MAGRRRDRREEDSSALTGGPRRGTVGADDRFPATGRRPGPPPTRPGRGLGARRSRVRGDAFVAGGRPRRLGWLHGGVHLHDAQGAQGARRQGHPRRRHPDRSCPARRSVSSGPTAPASPPCSRSWPGWSSRPTATPSCRPGYTVGILEQEPQLNEDKDVLGNVEEGVAEIKAQARPLQRDRREDGDRLLRRAAGRDGQAAGGHRPRQRLGPRRPARAGHGRAALPAAGRRRDRAVRR